MKVFVVLLHKYKGKIESWSTNVTKTFYSKHNAELYVDNLYNSIGTIDWFEIVESEIE